jgi:hypothetical protein
MLPLSTRAAVRRVEEVEIRLAEGMVEIKGKASRSVGPAQT